MMNSGKVCSLFIAMLIAMLLSALSGCGVLEPKGPPPDGLDIFFSGETKAELYQCG